MTDDDAAIVEKLQQAAGELGFRFTTPFSLGVFDGREKVYLGLVHEFGSRKGTLIGGDETPEGSEGEDGYSISVFGAAAVGLRNIEDIKEMLRDWGWHGDPSEKPGWYEQPG